MWVGILQGSLLCLAALTGARGDVHAAEVCYDEDCGAAMNPTLQEVQDGIKLDEATINPTRQEVQDDIKRDEDESTTKTLVTNRIILFWTSFFGRQDFHFGFGRQPFLDYCPINNCMATNDKTLVDQASAVVFHGRNFDLLTKFPAQREPWQRYAYFLLEHPYHQWNNLTKYNNIFNLTMTYRHDSDIVAPYGKVSKKLNLGSPNDINTKRNKLVAIFVSHCDTHSKRERYVAELSKHIPVDIYGECGPLKCPEYKMYDPHNHAPCYEMLERNYKFYLSFENIFCEDYVTEKLFNILRYNVVPIVMGAVNYTEIAPPNSVINILDFESPYHLAEYLHDLDKNDSRYLDYFAWKQHYEVSTDRYLIDPICDLCSLVNNDTYPRRVYDRLDGWWDQQGSCDLGVMDRFMDNWPDDDT